MIIELVQHICVTILIGYMSLTNMLAHHIQNMLAPADSAEVVVQASPLGGTLDKMAGLVERYAAATHILLESTDFQRAAVIASLDTEPSALAPSDIPLTEYIEGALLNVYCQYETDTYIRTTTGTGFFINQKGVILTNAHVAQFLLLEGIDDVVKNAECIIRSGNPATPKYRAELLYISPTWIRENARLVDAEAPRGTGERDYALLYVSESLDNSPLPSPFPTLTADTDLLPRGTVGTEVLSAGYPAGTLIQNGPAASLVPVIAAASVGTLYTFGSNYADIFSLSDSPVGEHGASGGPVVRDDHHAIGLIVTKGDTETEGKNSLRALTLSYIDRTITEETGFSLAQNMMGDVASRGGVFRSAMGPFLTQLLTDEL